MSNRKIIISALAGLAIGGIIGILFAPEKGSRTRRRIIDKSEDYVDDLKEKLKDTLDNMKAKYDKAVQNTEHLMSRETMSQDEVNNIIS